MFIQQFLDYIKFEKRYSKHTVVSYQTDLKQFEKYLIKEYQIEDVKEINYNIIRSWIVSLVDSKISSRSINRKITTLKSYYKFLLKEQQVDVNPMLKIVSPKSSKKLPVFIEQKKMNHLLDEIHFENDFTGIRDKLILQLFYYTGIRLSELINIKDSDISFSSNTIKVLGKRNKERILPFNIELKEAIQKYISVREIIIDEKLLLLTSKGKKLYEKLVYRVVKQYLNTVVTSNKKSPHILRHTFATHMLNNGAELNAVKELLGHANLSATQIYTHNTFEKLKKSYNQAHPRA